MNFCREDLDILDKFEFKIQPVGIKYLVRPPEGAERLEGNMALCEMLKKAQEGAVFYADVANHTCEAGPYVLGQAEIEGPFVSGEFGAGLEVFRDARAAARLYQYVPKIERGVVNYVLFAPLSALAFDPDLFIILAEISQADIILRATSYATGKMWSSRYSAAIGCSWIFADPYLRGEVNFFTTGFGSGMKRRKLFPEGMQLISIPFDQLPSVLASLKEMPWVTRPFQPDGVEYVKTLRAKLGLK